MTAGLNIVSAENKNVTTTLTSVPASEEENKLRIINEEERTGDIVSASEDGNYNISFDDGYNGYCINYRDHEATKGHNFTVQDTSEAINHYSKKSIGNELKTFFVDFYDIAMQDSIKTQHIIWHFSNDFTGWRVDPDLIEKIKYESSQKIIPDHGAIKRINNTTEAIFNFEVLDAHNEGHQNFFAYKITYRDIMEIIKNESENNPIIDAPNNDSENKTTTENATDISKNESIENTTTENATSTSNVKNKTFTKTNFSTPNLDENDESEKDLENKIKLDKHVTGYNYMAALIILIFGTILIIKYSRD